MSEDDRPLILTLALDGGSFAYLDGLRRRHFPADRNLVPAHLTLFHALPGRERDLIRRELGTVCEGQRPFELQPAGLRSLGRGVAVAFASAELVRLRQALAREWRDWLTPQDSAKIAPHVTIQNKVSPDEARRLMAQLTGELRPLSVKAEGLTLWRYLGGPWRLEKTFRFGG